jgi:predicted lipase
LQSVSAYSIVTSLDFRNTNAIVRLIAGHSLGGAIASLDALYLKLNLPSTIAVKAVTYGQPRVSPLKFHLACLYSWLFS